MMVLVNDEIIMQHNRRDGEGMKNKMVNVLMLDNLRDNILMIENKKENVLMLENLLCCDDCCEVASFKNTFNDVDYYCDYCFDEKHICYNCDGVFNNDDGNSHDGDFYCQDCFDEKFSCCEECDIYFPCDDGHYVDDKMLCNSCYDYNYVSCVNCSGDFHIDNCYNHDGDSYCDVCHSEIITCCEGCGDFYYNDDVRFNGRDDNYLCESCYAEVQPREINDYGYEPIFNYNKMPSENNVLLGIELEIECHNLEVQDVAKNYVNFLNENNLDDNFYLKSDGSLSNGIEIVSHPSTLQYHKKFNYRKMLQFLKDEKCTSYKGGSCGIHVHIDRNYLRNNDIKKMAVFFDNAKIEINKFSQRGNHVDYCKHVEYNLNDYKNYDYRNDDRYSELNLNSHTLEIRIARGTLDYERFSTWLMFCDALVYFVKNHSAMAMNWKNFMEYLKHSNRYNKLVTYLEIKVNEKLLRLENARDEN